MDAYTITRRQLADLEKGRNVELDDDLTLWSEDVTQSDADHLEAGRAVQFPGFTIALDLADAWVK